MSPKGLFSIGSGAARVSLDSGRVTDRVSLPVWNGLGHFFDMESHLIPCMARELLYRNYFSSSEHTLPVPDPVVKSQSRGKPSRDMWMPQSRQPLTPLQPAYSQWYYGMQNTVCNTPMMGQSPNVQLQSPAAFQPVFTSPSTPWQMSHGNQAAVFGPMRPQQTPSPVQIMQAEPATAQLAELGTKLKLSQTGSGTKETKECAYTPEDFRSMLARPAALVGVKGRL